MKTLKSTLALILLAAILVSSFCFPACAASAQSITYLEDGSYYRSLVGSEMCIRDRRRTAAQHRPFPARKPAITIAAVTKSYTLSR